jgi:predicted phosphodiesterase
MFAAWPTHFVFGNCDDGTEAFAAAIRKAGQTCHGQFGDLEFDGIRVALLHSHDHRKFRETIHSGQYRLVCYGHTHVAAIDRRGATVVLNPGAIYRAQPHSIAVVDLPRVEATIVDL